ATSGGTPNSRRSGRPMSIGSASCWTSSIGSQFSRWTREGATAGQTPARRPADAAPALLTAVKTDPKLHQSALLGGTQQAVFPSWGVALSSLRGLLFVRQSLAEQTPQTYRLRALQRDPDARVFVAD